MSVFGDIMARHGWSLPFDPNFIVPAKCGFSPEIDERHRCRCRPALCNHQATQEDLLCDNCREFCRAAESLEGEGQ